MSASAGGTRPHPVRAPDRSGAEPFIWLLFSSGGVVAALVLPVLLVLLGLAIPLGWVDAPSHAHLLAVLRNPLTKLGLIGICALALVHAAHRLRFTVEHALQLRRYDGIIAAACYGGALIGTAAAVYLLLGTIRG